MDDIASVICEKIEADAHESASASRVVLTYRRAGIFYELEVTIRRVAFGHFAFNHASEKTTCTVTAKNFSCVADMIVARIRNTIDCINVYSRTVKVLHDPPDDECVVLWEARTVFDGIEHDESQFKQLRSELEEAARVAWDGVVDVRDARDLIEADGLHSA